MLNYMSGGAHYRFGQKIDDAQWENNFRALYKNIAKHERVVFPATIKEIDEAKKLMHRLKYFLYGLYRVYEVLQQSKIWNF